MPEVAADPIKLSQVFFTNKQYNVDIVIPQRNEEITRARKQIQTCVEKIQRKIHSQLTSQGKKGGAFQVEKNLYPNLKQ